jgi:hypothetical protein
MNLSRPFADMRAGDVADIVEVEGNDAAESCVTDCFLRACEALLMQAIVIDSLLPILGHHAPRCGRLRTVVFHASSSQFRTPRRGGWLMDYRSGFVSASYRKQGLI